MAQCRNFSRFKMGRLEVSPSTEPCLHSFFPTKIVQHSSTECLLPQCLYSYTTTHATTIPHSVVSDRSCGKNNLCCSYLQWRQTPPNTDNTQQQRNNRHIRAKNILPDDYVWKWNRPVPIFPESIQAKLWTDAQITGKKDPDGSRKRRGSCFV